jgi:hypothetical protein
MFELVLVTFIFWSGSGSPDKMMNGPTATAVGQFKDQKACRDAIKTFDQANDWVSVERPGGVANLSNLVVVNLMCVPKG